MPVVSTVVKLGDTESDWRRSTSKEYIVSTLLLRIRYVDRHSQSRSGAIVKTTTERNLDGIVTGDISSRSASTLSRFVEIEPFLEPYVTNQYPPP